MWTEPGSTPGQHDVFAALAFESGELVGTTRDLSTEVFFLINGATVMNVSRTLVILGGSGTYCLAPPCERVNLLREPDAGKPHVRFDERDVETEHGWAIEAPPDERGGNR